MPRESGDIVPAIIDTTVWIDFFRNEKTEQTDLLELVVRRGDAALGDLIVSEVLQGVDSDKEFRSLRRHFSSFQVYPMVGRRNAIQSALNYRKLRAKGLASARLLIVGSPPSVSSTASLFSTTIAISTPSSNT